MIPRLVTPPTVEPVTLAEAKEHLRVLHGDDDVYIESCITAAREMIESGESWSLDRSLINTTWRVVLDEWPFDEDGDGGIVLPRPPLVSVTSIAYLDTTNVSRTLSSTLYTVDTHSEPGRVVPSYGSVWPEVLDHINAVTITYVAGYGATAASVPTSIKQAILIGVADLYGTGRETNVVGTIVNQVPTIRNLLNAHKWSYR
mgnify:CR=1 FL=1